MSIIRTAREAAERYAHDEAFAEAFDARLAELFRDQARRLERLAARLEKEVLVRDPVESGSAEPEKALPVAAPSHAEPTAVSLQKVVEVLRESAGRQGLTRGQLSAYLGVESGDIRLSRALRTLKDDGTIKQQGIRRSARYRLNKPTKP